MVCYDRISWDDDVLPAKPGMWISRGAATRRQAKERQDGELDSSTVVIPGMGNARGYFFFSSQVLVDRAWRAFITWHDAGLFSPLCAEQGTGDGCRCMRHLSDCYLSNLSWPTKPDITAHINLESASVDQVRRWCHRSLGANRPW